MPIVQSETSIFAIFLWYLSYLSESEIPLGSMTHKEYEAHSSCILDEYLGDFPKCKANAQVAANAFSWN